jgi:hypothetical protein
MHCIVLTFSTDALAKPAPQNYILAALIPASGGART